MDSFDTDVLLVGAGPAGLAIANLLALRGARVIVLEQREDLIDYPRGVGLDDESLRTVQAMGLIERVLPHTAPQHIMRLVNGRGHVMAEMGPTTKEFGWSRRNAFVQPLVDRELYEGLGRFDKSQVEVRFGREVTSIEEQEDRVVAHVRHSSGSGEALSGVSARYLVGTDGGRSMVRKQMGVSFEGVSPSTRWLVVDLRRDPLGTPNVFLGADPHRPYVSLGLPGAIRRFEFMLFDDEPDEIIEQPGFVESLLEGHLPQPGLIEPIRKRVFTHHARIASSFGRGRLFIAGDAAHLMPVWQGQGYNSGIRDATNLAWKLAAVVAGECDDALLDTYTVERRDHAKAMINISNAFGSIIKPTNRFLAAARDAAALALNLSPAAKAYFVQMKYKPMPRYTSGVVVDPNTLEPGNAEGRLTRQLSAITTANSRISPVGTQFIQPRVRASSGETVLLDEVLGIGWSLLIWGAIPEEVFESSELEVLARIGARAVTLRPTTQALVRPTAVPGAQVVADVDGVAKRWFDDRPTPVLFLRPDRFIAAAALVQEAPLALAALTRAMYLRPSRNG